MEHIRIKQADYLTDYKIAFQFNDGTQQIIDFGEVDKINAKSGYK